MTRSRAAYRQRGSVALDTAFVLPVLLTVAMMAFEIARYALVLVIGSLALDSALGGLRQRSDAAFAAGGNLEAIIKADMLVAAYGYLGSDEVFVRATTHASLSEFGGARPDAETNPDFPVVAVEVVVTQDWITALPTFLGLPARFSHTYRQAWGTLHRAERRPS